jgi:signal transduction histidine kinase
MAWAGAARSTGRAEPPITKVAMGRAQEIRLVSRFALTSLVAFVAVGATLSIVVTRQIRERQEDLAKFHAEFLVDSILRYELTADDLAAPLAVDGARYRELLLLVRARVLEPPVVRVKVYDRDGTVVFSDEPRLVGTKLEPGGEIEEALEGVAVTEVSELEGAENLYERGLAPKLFEAYVPLYVFPSERGAPDGVVEVYMDYAGIQGEIDTLFWIIAAALLVGLSALYVLQLPISHRVGRRLSEQNRQLEEQSTRLQETVLKEQQTVAELRELNRLKDEFVAVASHEVRTPLTSIIGYAKTLQRPEFADDAPAREEFLRAIERQGARLSQLVENLLATSQIESEQRGATVEWFSFPELADEVVAGLGPRAHRVRVAVHADMPEVATNRQRIELILANLLDNALKFSPEHTLCELGAHVANGSLLFWVRDQGVGIAADQVDRVFERFYQIDSSITRRFGGVGLGLGLVKELVTSLGGTIEVTSEPGRGSTFTATVPLEQGAGIRKDGDAAVSQRRRPGPRSAASPRPAR